MAPAGVAGDPGAGSCGLTTWGFNSQVTHVSSTGLTEAFTRNEVAVKVWSHNPLVRVINGTYVMSVLWGVGVGGSDNLVVRVCVLSMSTFARSVPCAVCACCPAGAFLILLYRPMCVCSTLRAVL
jgi:hypothetical protein